MWHFNTKVMVVVTITVTMAVCALFVAFNVSTERERQQWKVLDAGLGYQ